MKKIIPTIVIASCILLASCKKNSVEADNNNITTADIFIENGAEYSSRIDEVRLEQGVWNATKEDFTYTTLVTAAYNDGSLSLNLPETVSTTEADRINTDFELEEGETLIENTITVSDKNARWVVPVFNTYQSGNWCGTLYYSNDNGNTEYHRYYCYADKPVTIKGKYTVREDETGYTYATTINSSLKKGWNLLYETYTENDNSEEDIVSGTAPAVSLKWRVYYGGYVAAFTGAASKPNKRVKQLPVKLQRNR